MKVLWATFRYSRFLGMYVEREIKRLFVPLFKTRQIRLRPLIDYVYPGGFSLKE
jgi:hypothetical protein